MVAMKYVIKIFSAVYWWFRYSVLPVSYYITRLVWWWIGGEDDAILHAEGMHYIEGFTGAGKTLLAFHIVHEKRAMIGKNSYISAPFDLTHKHKVFKMGDYFGDGKIKKRFDNRKYATVVFDELHRDFNRRQNKKTEYNDVFVPAINYFTIHRHQGFRNLYFISQLESDTQLMSIMRFRHKVYLKKSPLFWHWLFTGKKRVIPKKWYIETMQKTPNDEWVLVKQWKKRVNVALLDVFDTHAYRHDLDDVPYDTDMKGVMK